MMIRCRGNSIFILNEFLSLQAVVFHRVVHFFCEIFQHFLQTIRNSSFVHFMTPKKLMILKFQIRNRIACRLTYHFWYNISSSLSLMLAFSRSSKRSSKYWYLNFFLARHSLADCLDLSSFDWKISWNHYQLILFSIAKLLLPSCLIWEISDLVSDLFWTLFPLMMKVVQWEIPRMNLNVKT